MLHLIFDELTNPLKYVLIFLDVSQVYNHLQYTKSFFYVNADADCVQSFLLSFQVNTAYIFDDV